MSASFQENPASRESPCERVRLGSRRIGSQGRSFCFGISNVSVSAPKSAADRSDLRANRTHVHASRSSLTVAQILWTLGRDRPKMMAISVLVRR